MFPVAVIDACSNEISIDFSIIFSLAGMLIDASGSTDIVFFVFGAVHLFGGFVFIAISQLTAHLKKKDNTHEKNDKLESATLME